MKDKIQICFVCTDNIGRSVIGEYCLKDFLVRNKIQNVAVSSAGTNANSDISGYSMAHFSELKKLGIDASGHTRRQLTKAILEGADKTIIFDFINREWTQEKFNVRLPLFNQIYKKQELPIRVSGPDLIGTLDERMIKVTHYIYDAIPTLWEKIKRNLEP